MLDANCSMTVSNLVHLLQYSDTKTREDLSNRFFIGTSFLVKPKEGTKTEQEMDDFLEMPPTPNINDLFDDADGTAWVN